VGLQSTSMETQMAEHINAILLANPAPKTSQFAEDRDPDTNTYSLAPQHITSTSLLTGSHPVRAILATAAVEGYVRRGKHKFLKEIREAPTFAVDLMEVKETLQTVASSKRVASFTAPFSGKTLSFCTDGG